MWRDFEASQGGSANARTRRAGACSALSPSRQIDFSHSLWLCTCHGIMHAGYFRAYSAAPESEQTATHSRTKRSHSDCATTPCPSIHVTHIPIANSTRPPDTNSTFIPPPCPTIRGKQSTQMRFHQSPARLQISCLVAPHIQQAARSHRTLALHTSTRCEAWARNITSTFTSDHVCETVNCKG